MKYTSNPRGKITDWRKMYDQIEAERKKGIPVQIICTHLGIATTTYYQWRKRVAKQG